MTIDFHCSTALFVAYMIYFRPEWLVHPLISVVGPIVVAIVLAYVVSRIFMELFIITLDTLMLCYCEEKRAGPEVTKPTQQPTQVELPPPSTSVAAVAEQPVAGPVAVMGPLATPVAPSAAPPATMAPPS